MTTLTTSPGLAPDIADLASDSVAAPRERGLLNAYMQLTKARLSALVLLTAAVGFILASTDRVNWLALFWTLLGTGLAAGCASALNQVLEVNRDRLMQRTRSRPLPSGQMSIAHSIFAALAMGTTGVALLWAMINATAAALALLTIVIYVAAYTPLKVRSSFNTLVGAICGAIPPMIGWVAASGSIDQGAWVLAFILFVWQIPHFLALAWLYRDDYRRGGFVMLPVIDLRGRLTSRVIVLTAALLLPLGLLATMWRIAGAWYAVGSLALGAWMLALCLQFYFSHTRISARRIFLASIIYLPALLCLMVFDRGSAI